MKLNKTTILPVDDPDLSLRMVKALVEEELLTLFLALGKGPAVEQLVQQADAQAQSGKLGRHVVWARETEVVKPYLQGLEDPDGFGADLEEALAITISPADILRDRISKSDPPPRPFRIFLSYSKAELSI